MNCVICLWFNLENKVLLSANIEIIPQPIKTPHHDWEAVIRKLVDDQCWFRTHVAIIGLTVLSFPWFPLPKRCFHKYAFSSFRKTPSPRGPAAYIPRAENRPTKQTNQEKKSYTLSIGCFRERWYLIRCSIV